MNNISKLMKYEIAGDPISGTLWTRKTREMCALKYGIPKWLQIPPMQA